LIRPAARLSVLRLVIAACALWALLAVSAFGQALPIPGLPGNLGGAGQTEPAPQEGAGGGNAGQEGTEGSVEAAPDAATTGGDQAGTASGAGAGAAGQTGGAAGGAAAAPTQALIDILRDEAAREALIAELERAADGAETGPGQEAAAPPATEGGAGEAAAGEAAAAPPGVQTPLTFGEQAVAVTRSIGAGVMVWMEEAWLRVQRIPSTFKLSLRIFEDDLLESVAEQILALAGFLYAALLVLRLAVRPLRHRIALAGEGATWFRRLFLRLMASLVHAVTLPIAVFTAVFLMLLFEISRADAEGNPLISDEQALFINAFVSVEGARIVLRLILSPGSRALRMVSLPEAAARSLWHMGSAVVYALGYGMVFFVPVVSSGISLFVGRAAASVLSSLVVAAVIAYVLANRHAVADWLNTPPRSGIFSEVWAAVAKRWHWPVLVYLLYMLGTVLTRPGNVLLPLLLTTGEVALLVLAANVATGALANASARRLRVPPALGELLPLLEERVNQLFPAILRVAGVLVTLILWVLLLDILGIQSVGGILSSERAERISAGLFSVLLVLAALSLVWLAMTSWVDFRLNPFVGNVPTPREITLLTLVRNAATVALIIIGVITSLAQLGMNIGPLLASAGVLGLAISFGSQRMVEDIFSGIFIQAENAMNVGDVVDVGGTVGTVEKLTVRSVTLRDLSGVVHVIPFSSAAKISNYMRDFSYHVADIGVAYREDVDDVRQAMHDAFDELRRHEEFGQYLLGDLEWFGLNSFGASELMMRARIKTAPGQQWGVGRAYNAIVKRIFDERGIEIPFPHQTIYFGEDKSGEAPPMNLRIRRDRQRNAPAPVRHLAAAPDAHGADKPAHGDEEEAHPGRQSVRGVDMPDSADR